MDSRPYFFCFVLFKFAEQLALLFPCQDLVRHLVCVEVSAEFLAFSKSAGNDLSTPRPEFGFPGLVPGNRWCLLAPRWVEAQQHGMAPRIVLLATHEGTLNYTDLKTLKAYALDLS